MGRIKKVAGPKHEATLSPALSEFVSTATGLSLEQLPKHLHSFPTTWPFPRGDLYHWIPLLDYFDSILERFTQEYGLNSGPQTQSFGRRLLEKDRTSRKATSGEASTDFGPDGDREVVEVVLNFSRILLENCGNRSLYSSSDRLGELLNTTSLSLLYTTLRLATRLAQRYHASRQRGANSSQHTSNALLASHYNINLDHVQQLADRLVRPSPFTFPSLPAQATLATPTTAKGKRKDSSDHGKATTSISGSDMFSAIKDDRKPVNGSTGGQQHSDVAAFEDWGEVRMVYYQPATTAKDDVKVVSNAENKNLSTPDSPTLARRTSGVSRPSRLSISEDSSSTTNAASTAKPEDTGTGMGAGVLRVVVIPAATITTTPLEKILEANLPDLPKQCHYEFLCRIRAARAVTESLATRRQLVAIRVLAITNLAYVYPEAVFQQKILQLDSEEPRRLQLVYQLADIVHPPGGNQAGIPLFLKTAALGALEALAKHKSRSPDVCTALNVNVNHGVLLYILRKTVADLAEEYSGQENIEEEEWREALFSLLEALPSAAPRTAESLVGAGLFEVLIEVLRLRTSKAERAHPKALMFMNTIIYTVRDAFQSFANAKGLDAVSDLISWEVSTALACVEQGNGLPEQFKTQVMDYQMPYFQQQTLRWLLKFLNHMMQHGNTNFDRLLRNLIDSPQLLSGLRQIIANAKVFGSNVWSGAVNILSHFIHNEPTSYAVIAEAGLSKTFLEAITLTELDASSPEKNADENNDPENASSAPTVTVPTNAEDDTQAKRKVSVTRPKGEALALGILPATDAIVTVPNAFGAICLNTSGLEMFLRSRALESFFEVFESPDHVKSLAAETDLPRLLGNSFDELVRHHPRLKSAVMASVVLMLARVVRLCASKAWQHGVGAKLWTEKEDGGVIISGGKKALLGDMGGGFLGSTANAVDDDIVMDDDTPWKSDGSAPPGLTGKETEKKAPEQQGPSVPTYIKVATKFLTGFFENNTLCALFNEAGGFEWILDFATLPSLPYDFNNQGASHEVARVVHMLIDQKPHLVLPSLILRTMKTLDVLEPLMNYSENSPFFSQFITQNPKTNHVNENEEQANMSIDGTSIIKALVNVHTLCNILYETFSQPTFTHRAHHHTLFSQVNLTDMYITLVKRLGVLQRSCVWQEILLQNNISESLKEATRIKGYGMGSDEADEIFGFLSSDSPTTFSGQTAGQGTRATSTSRSLSRSNSAMDTTTNGDGGSSGAPKIEDTALFQNVQSIRYLLSQVPSSITPFFQSLGKSLVPKRRLDSYLRQCAHMIADAMAESTLEQLQYDLPKRSPSVKDRYAYWIVILTSISQLMMEGPMERPHSQCLTLVLQSFKNLGGLDAIEELLVMFFDEVKALSAASGQTPMFSEDAGRLTSAYGGIKIILTFYSQITTARNIIESQQTNGMSGQDRDREHPYYFSANQFLVELRMAVLPVVRSIWDSEFTDRASSSILKCLIGILGTILDAEHEHGALRRSDKVPIRAKPQHKVFSINKERENALEAKGFKPEIAREALYRCINNREAAEEYCKARNELERYTANPIPEYDVEKRKSPSPVPQPVREDSQATVPEAETSSQTDRVSLPSTASPAIQPSTVQEPQVEVEETDDSGLVTPAILPPPAPEWPPAPDNNDEESMNIDNLFSIASLLNPIPTTEGEHATSNQSLAPDPVVTVVKAAEMTTVDDLEDERSVLRKNLIDRALDVLAVHGDVTFELADLITMAASKAPDALTMRKEIGETLIQSLISFQMPEEDVEELRSTGKKIAAYANLLALVLQEKEFYEASLDELRSNLGMLLTFIKMSPTPSDQNTEDASPWVGQILLIVEKLLAEDVQPQQIKWTPPSSDGSPHGDTVIEMEEPVVSHDDKLQLVEAIIDILPRIGKDDSLALSVTRVLVILSRNRDIANILSEKRNLQRLFVMVKQLAGINDEKLQSAFMLVLRHIIEDDDTIRQIMRAEIIANFEMRPSRPIDTTSYVRQMYHLVLRSPSIFVEVTNQLLKLQKFDPSQRPQILVLKTEATEPGEVPKNVETPGVTHVRTEDDHSALKDEIKQSTEDASTLVPLEKSKTQDVKAPTVEHPDGVIHYILSQLLSYKDVEDKDPESTAKDTAKDAAKDATSATAPDVDMTNGSTPPPQRTVQTRDGEAEKRPEKSEFKFEQHPIFIYRCFLLHCLAELLASYNRTKIEFINFSRKADPKAMTPSKPRSGILNYLLNVLLPIGTLDSNESPSQRKRCTTSNWAISTIVSLCMRTGEKGYDRPRTPVEEEQEPDLLFVRKFVLEHALKAYKDAHASNEPLDVKYARMLSLADLFSRLLAGRPIPNAAQHINEISATTQKELAKIMFERNFISALTASIADIDLNFPGSKRAIKHILKPLKVLTETAIYLSETSSISTVPGLTDDDDISTASSVSDLDHEREETPDLFRHSTLGMLEPGREERSSTESSDEDEDMYDDEYDDGMEYDEEMDRDGDEVVSDEDEELEGAGHVEGLPGDVGMDVEVVIDGEDDNDDDDDDDDDDEDEEDPDDSEDIEDGEEIEIIDEINGDRDNDSMAEGDEEEWQDEDEGGDHYPGQDEMDRESSDAQEHHRHRPDVVIIPPARDIVREIIGNGQAIIDTNAQGYANLAMDIENEVYMDDVVREDDDDDEDDEDDFDEEDVIYEPGMDDDGSGLPDPPWGWDTDEELPVPRGHSHHHHSRRLNPWTMFPAGTERGMIVPAFRTHRAGGMPRGTDDGINPLLLRSGSSGAASGHARNRHPPHDPAANMSDWVHAINPRHQGDGAVSFINSIVSAVGQGGAAIGAVGGPGALHFHIGGSGPHGRIPPEVQAVLGLRRPMPEQVRVARDDPLQIVEFVCPTTVIRWQEEARLLYGSNYNEKTQRVVNSLLKLLVPPAIEEEKIRLEKEAEAAEALKKQREEEAKAKAEEEERLAKEKAEKEAQEKREQEEREAAATAAAENEPAAAAPPAEADSTPGGDAMEGVEATESVAPAVTAEVSTAEETPSGGESSEPTERVRATFRGREVDITGLGIDLEYLDALPEELREEVLMQQLAEQRSQAAAAGEEPTEISREFLEALPAEIREELLQQEAQERRRRERDEARRRAANGGPAVARAEEMDPASFLASLDPHLRQAVLAEQSDAVLAQLPPNIAAEARALGQRWDDSPRGHHPNGRTGREGQDPDASTRKPPRRQIVQMLDKAGVATLLRLLFVSQQGTSRQTLNEILHNVSQNRQNRAEVVSLMLSILQDGSADVNAVERSFVHLSLRAKQPASQKTPQPLKRTLTGQMGGPLNAEMTPLMVIQQCLNALVHLTEQDPHIRIFFLMEHETSSGLKSKSAKKGKGKESRASKFAVNALLSLLDRKLIMESSGCMEQLSTLLQSITHPLTMFLRENKDQAATEAAKGESSTTPADPGATGTETAIIGEAHGQTDDTSMADPSSASPEAQPEVGATTDTSAQLNVAENTDEATSAPAEGKKEDSTESKTKKWAKKQRTPTPPVVPEYNLRLVVNILAARECSAKTFRDTLSTINNLSAIPGAKEIFGKELIKQAQDLGESISQDLDELIPEIRNAASGTEIQGMALAKFSPPSSDQAKLLRILTALDYLFDPKRNGGKTETLGEANSSMDDIKEDLLTTLYENSTFGPLWAKLSDCLSVIRQRDNMVNIATILLPLVESLMVVCKNTTLKDISSMKMMKEFSVASPPPETAMENLFFRFTEDHRKILNDLVRHNPRLMSGTFSLLVKNPKVLEFDNKRNYFTRRLHTRTDQRHPQPPLQLFVRREQVFLDSFKSLHFQSPEEMKFGKLNVRFHGEEGVDAGGVTREWFQVMSRQMFNADYALFIPVASDRTTFHPNVLSHINPEHLMFFKFIGRVIGKALYEGRALDCHFSRAVYKRILGKPVSIKDMETLDLDYYKSLLWMLENDISDIITETFSIETEAFGVTQIVDLIENGRNIPVTEENKQEYVQLVVEYRLTGSVNAQLEEFLKGFHDIVPADLIEIFNEQELELLISGLPDIDVDDWKNNTEYHNYQSSSAQIQWFWRAVRSFDKEERAKLLQFVTGTSKVPLNGFKELEGMNGFSRFNIHRDYGNKDRLPSSHTCFNQLDLPEYESYEILRQQVYTAMTAGSEYFGFA